MRRVNVILQLITLGILGTLAGGEHGDALEQPSTTPTRDSDLVLFANGDTLHGTLVSLKNGKLEWRSSRALGNMFFKIQSVKGLRLENKPRKTRIKNNAILYLTNNDTISARVDSINDETVEISTAYAGKVTLPRNAIALIAFDPKDIYLYRGPLDMDTWETRTSGKYSDNIAIVLGAKLFMEEESMTWIKIPSAPQTPVAFSFEIVNPEKHMDLAFCFFADDKISNATSDSYTLNISNGHYELSEYNADNNETDTIERNSLPMRTTPSRVSIMVDGKQEKFTLFFDGKKAKVCTRAGQAKQGRNIGFLNSGSVDSIVAIKNIVVSKWNGKKTPATVAFDETILDSASGDSIFLINGDRMVGALKSLSRRNAVFSTEFAELKIPIERIAMISMNEKKQHMAKKHADDAVVNLLDRRGRITLSSISIENGVLEGETENFGGKIRLDMATLESIDLNTR